MIPLWRRRRRNRFLRRVVHEHQRGAYWSLCRRKKRFAVAGVVVKVTLREPPKTVTGFVTASHWLVEAGDVDDSRLNPNAVTGHETTQAES